ncbi:hypothetical protein SAMN05216226_10717 [Halovenus aranensis]|uniref:Uncharacterized protein n=1 Tax=Halovenus aranensis TaxID=890420 RepID=A0A1G8VNI3_9EURY|nr:hypothetical protein SAMN05216226_10717 [Halovenus aranensis]
MPTALASLVGVGYLWRRTDDEPES